MGRKGTSRASFFRHQKKKREKNKFLKFECTCNCILHKNPTSKEPTRMTQDVASSSKSNEVLPNKSDSSIDLEFEEAAFLEEERGSRGSNEEGEFENGSQNESGDEESEDSSDDEFDDDDDDDDDDDNDFDPPDDPDDPNANDEGNQDNNDVDDDTPNFGLNHPHLNNQVRMVRNITVREVLLMVIALGVRHSLAYNTMVNMLMVLNTIFGRKYLPVSKETLFKLLGKDRTGIKKHYYCKWCKKKIENIEELPDRSQCDTCQQWNEKRKLPFFVSVSLKKQLRYLLETPGFHENLNYREERVKRDPNNIEDILDGRRYSELSQPGNVLSNRNNFSYGLNNDGFKITRTSNADAQPVYLKLNELSPLVRQKYILLAGIWIDEETPNMNYLLEKCLTEQANELSSNGLQWRRNEEYVQSLFIPVYCTADAKAKALLLNLNEPTGRRSCLFCDVQGVQARGIKFPMWPYHRDDPEPLPRTHESITADMRAAVEQRRMVNGFRGASEFLNLDFFNLKEGFSTDDLHPIFVGVVKDYFEMIFLQGTHYIGPDNVALVNRRWLTIKFPNCIARKPRKIVSYKRWRGTEFRNFLLYGLTCLEGAVDGSVIDNLSHLANAVFLLSKESISEDDLIQAEEDIMVFLHEFQELFHVEEMKFNVHVLLHLVEVVRTLGNLYAHSTFNFESWNHRLKKYVTSSWGTCDQVVFRLLLSSFVSAARYDDRIEERVKLTVESIVLRTRLDNALKVGDVYLLGKVEQRQATPEEQELLVEEGIVLDNINILVYKRAYYQNVECRSVQYTREGRKDSSNIHTKVGTFASIQQILVVRSGGESITGMLCFIYDNLQAVPFLTYMFEVLHNNQQNMTWVPFDRLSSLAVKCTVPLGTYIAPIPNNVEID